MSKINIQHESSMDPKTQMPPMEKRPLSCKIWCKTWLPAGSPWQMGHLHLKTGRLVWWISVINWVWYTSCWWKISGVYQLPYKISRYLQGLILVRWLAGFLQNWTIQEDIWEQKHDTKLESRKLQHFKSLFECCLCKQTPNEKCLPVPVLLMEEIPNNRLECIKNPVNNGFKLPTSTG